MKKKIIRIAIEVFALLYILEDGQPLQLQLFQLDYILRPIFNTLDARGLRQFNQALIGLCKKNGKSTLASLIALYMLLADGEPYPEVYGAAGSRDQARIIFNQTVRAIQRSPLLKAEVNIYKDAIERKDGTGIYKVLSADAELQHGLNPHCVIFDEMWNQPNYALYEALTTSPARRQPLTFIVTYAGFKPWAGELLWDLYEKGMAGVDPRFYFFWTGENLASWVTTEYLDQQRSRLPDHIYRRLHCNEWTTGEGSLLTREDISSAIDMSMIPVFQGNPSYQYHLALDLGLRRDRTALAIVHRDKGMVFLDHIKVFQAPKGGEVKVEEVEYYIMDLKQSFRFSSVSFDPWQSASLRQRLESKGLRVHEFSFSGQSWPQLSMNLLGLFKDRRIRIYNHDDLVRELQTVSIVEKAYGFKLENKSGTHDDMVVALGMAALKAMEGAEGTCDIISMPSVTGGLLYQKEFGIEPPREPIYDIRTKKERAEGKAEGSTGIWSSGGGSVGGCPEGGW